MYLGFGKRPAQRTIDVPINRLEAFIEVHPPTGTLGYYARYRVNGINEAVVLDNMVKKASELQAEILAAYKGRKVKPEKIFISLTYPRFSQNGSITKQGEYALSDLLRVAAVVRNSHIWNHAVMEYLAKPESTHDPRLDHRLPANRRHALPNEISAEEILSDEYSAVSWYNEIHAL